MRNIGHYNGKLLADTMQGNTCRKTPRRNGHERPGPIVNRVLKNHLRCHNCVKNRLTCLRPNAAGGPEGVSEANQMLIYDQ
jgi:hypothetical protein